MRVGRTCVEMERWGPQDAQANREAKRWTRPTRTPLLHVHEGTRQVDRDRGSRIRSWLFDRPGRRARAVGRPNKTANPFQSSPSKSKGKGRRGEKDRNQIATQVQQRAMLVLACLVRQAEAIQCRRRTSTRRLIRGRVVEGWPEQFGTGGSEVIMAGHVLGAGEESSRALIPAGDDIHWFSKYQVQWSSRATHARSGFLLSDEAARIQSWQRSRVRADGAAMVAVRVTPRAHRSKGGQAVLGFRW